MSLRTQSLSSADTKKQAAVDSGFAVHMALT